MREIKFRGKRVDNGELVCGCLIQPWNGVRHLSKIHDGLYEYEVIPESIGQFTGLLDINDNEVYEGDIVYALKHNEIPFTKPVEWRYGVFWFGNWNWIEFQNIFRRIEVIGSIHDNSGIFTGGVADV